MSRALLAEVREHPSVPIRGRSLMGSCCASPKGFHHLVAERKKPHGNNSKEWKAALQLCTSSENIKR